MEFGPGLEVSSRDIPALHNLQLGLGRTSDLVDGCWYSVTGCIAIPRVYSAHVAVGVTNCGRYGLCMHQYDMNTCPEPVYARSPLYSECDCTRIKKMAEYTIVKYERAGDAANGTALATIRYTPGHFFRFLCYCRV